jgi:hypothetical protein
VISSGSAVRSSAVTICGIPPISHIDPAPRRTGRSGRLTQAFAPGRHPVDNMRKSQGFPSSSPQPAARTVSDDRTNAGTAATPPLRAVGGDAVSTYEVTLKDRTVEVVEGADAYQQEGQMTTFFATDGGRRVVDCWSQRLASFRTSEVVIIRRIDRILPALLPDDADADRKDVPPAKDPAVPLVHLRSA